MVNVLKLSAVKSIPLSFQFVVINAKNLETLSQYATNLVTVISAVLVHLDFLLVILFVRMLMNVMQEQVAANTAIA